MQARKGVKILKLEIIHKKMILKIFIKKGSSPNYSERLNKVVIARSAATWQSHEIASLRSQ